MTCQAIGRAPARPSDIRFEGQQRTRYAQIEFFSF
jgi:hypothetical protein